MVSAIWTIQDHDFAISVTDLKSFRVGVQDFGSWAPPPGNPFEIVVDLGANVGTFSLYAVQFHDAKMVYAYEPVPVNFQHLTGTIAMNGHWGRIIPIPYAICRVNEARIGVMKGITSGQFSMEYNDTLPAPFSPLKVPQLPIVEMLENYPRIDFLKMDIEGSEWGIFDDLASSKKAANLWREKVAHTMIELHPLNDTRFFKGDDRSEKRIEEWLRDNGYDVTVCDDQYRTVIATRRS